MNKLVVEVKAAQEDFEFYPTTNEIIDCLIKDLDDSYNGFKSFLDIGAGSGKVLSKIKEKFDSDIYAIEKSKILLNNLHKDIYVIGTDFYEQSLISKNIDITFSNPPYSEYENWSEKIIRESNSHKIYLVLPERWIHSEILKQAIEYREVEYEIIGNFDFLNSEDRQARAKVNLIRIVLNYDEDDSFRRLFNEEFKGLKGRLEEKKKDSKENKFGSLVVGENYIGSMVELYNQDVINIKNNYDSISKLDVSLLKEFNIETDKILELLKERLSGLKNLYWHEIISRMSELTNRLTTKNREKILKRLQENGNVDFTKDNIYSVVIWVLKNANDYIDEQLIQVYEKLICKANIVNYKSNEKIYKNDRWRYNEEKPSHVSLEYRLVLEGRYISEFISKYRISEYGSELIRDLLTVAHNLGFKSNTVDNRLSTWGYDWEPGKTEEFYSENEILLEVKAYKNGNLHVRMNQKFALALNVEYGRLKGWLHSKEEANYELNDNKASEVFNINCNILNIKNLLLADYSS
ncbi:MAG: DUF4942 domain-containing protein [Methanothrix sp.]|jgi:hypothetical protein|nr:DUF4942 domain-containing protein [Methanothrix sp.]